MTFEELLRQLAAPARRALASNGAHDLASLAVFSAADIAAWHGIGPKAMIAIRAALELAGNASPGQPSGDEP